MLPYNYFFVKNHFYKTHSTNILIREKKMEHGNKLMTFNIFIIIIVIYSFSLIRFLKIKNLCEHGFKRC